MKLLTAVISVIILFASTIGVYESPCCCCFPNGSQAGDELTCCCGECYGECGDGCDCDFCSCSPFVTCGTCVGFEVMDPVTVKTDGLVVIRKIIIPNNDAMPCGWRQEILQPPRFIG